LGIYCSPIFTDRGTVGAVGAQRAAPFVCPETFNYEKNMSENKKPVLLSGIQPTGKLHIGHYLGAIKNWFSLQDTHQCLFMLVDLHAITIRQDPNEFKKNCYNLLALYLALGLDPQKSLIFLQSHVSQHSQLAWILNCYTYMGELSRMTQFKDKSKQHEQNINVGLFSYPTLMAADILLYDTNLVPVGADQKQHIEITRDIAMRFNNIYGNIFTIPKPYIPELGARVMSLQDPNKKMSKSDSLDENLINLLDTPEKIAKKIKRAVTDSGSEVRFDLAEKPGVANLLTIFSLVTGKTISDLEKDYVGSGYGKFKNDLAEAVNAFLAPIQLRFREIRADESQLQTILHANATKAKVLAAKTLKKVSEVLGFID
jgi:tryptophanyl-tRNA synthetase